MSGGDTITPNSHTRHTFSFVTQIPIERSCLHNASHTPRPPSSPFAFWVCTRKQICKTADPARPRVRCVHFNAQETQPDPSRYYYTLSSETTEPPQKYVVVVPILLFNDRTSKRNDIESVEPTNERHFYFRRVNAFVVRGEALRFLVVLLCNSTRKGKEGTVKLAGRERFKFNLLFPLRNRHRHSQRHG